MNVFLRHPDLMQFQMKIRIDPPEIFRQSLRFEFSNLIAKEKLTVQISFRNRIKIRNDKMFDSGADQMSGRIGTESAGSSDSDFHGNI